MGKYSFVKKEKNVLASRFYYYKSFDGGEISPLIVKSFNCFTVILMTSGQFCE